MRLVTKNNFMDALVSQQMQADLEISSFWHRVPRGTHIDEMSLLFADHQQEKEFEPFLRKEGWDQFNEVTDKLTCLTDGQFRGTGFHVRFRFWSHPSLPFRIEAMTMTEDLDCEPAPLHDHALVISQGNPVIIHASFKLPDIGAYAAVCQNNIAGRALSYENSYGRFSYFGQLPTYLKPRVNLRDQ